MKSIFRNMLIGFGSILAIAPHTNYAVNKYSDRDNLANDWYRIGDDIRKAMNIVSNEKEKEARS